MKKISNSFKHKKKILNSDLYSKLKLSFSQFCRINIIDRRRLECIKMVNVRLSTSAKTRSHFHNLYRLKYRRKTVSKKKNESRPYL